MLHLLLSLAGLGLALFFLIYGIGLFEIRGAHGPDETFTPPEPIEWQDLRQGYDENGAPIPGGESDAAFEERRQSAHLAHERWLAKRDKRALEVGAARLGEWAVAAAIWGRKALAAGMAALRARLARAADAGGARLARQKTPPVAVTKLADIMPAGQAVAGLDLARLNPAQRAANAETAAQLRALHDELEAKPDLEKSSAEFGALFGMRMRLAELGHPVRAGAPANIEDHPGWAALKAEMARPAAAPRPLLGEAIALKAAASVPVGWIVTAAAFAGLGAYALIEHGAAVSARAAIAAPCNDRVDRLTHRPLLDPRPVCVDLRAALAANAALAARANDAGVELRRANAAFERIKTDYVAKLEASEKRARDVNALLARAKKKEQELADEARTRPHDQPFDGQRWMRGRADPESAAPAGAASGSAKAE